MIKYCNIVVCLKAFLRDRETWMHIAGISRKISEEVEDSSLSGSDKKKVM